MKRILLTLFAILCIVSSAQANDWTVDTNNISITGGTISGTTIGDPTPAAGTFSPVKAKGPAIITTFAGTVTATASTTVTFSSAADAILAGYSATNPMLGTTLISNALTRYIVSWTNATTCVVNSAVTWAGTAITSTQLPITTFVDSSGVTKGWMNAAGNVYFVDSVGIGTGTPLAKLQVGANINTMPTNTSLFLRGVGGGVQSSTVLDGRITLAVDTNADYGGYIGNLNIDGTSTGQALVLGDRGTGGDHPAMYLRNGNVGIGTTTFGTSAAIVLGIGSGTAPTTSPTNAAQMWVADRGAVAGDAALHMRDEVGTNGPVAFATQRVITQAATDTLTLNEVMGTVISNYGQAAENTQTLPAAAAGYKGRVSISTTGAGAFHLKAGASDKIYLNGTALDDGDKVSLAAPAVGDYFDFWTIQTAAAAWDWVVVSGVGILIDGGV